MKIRKKEDIVHIRSSDSYKGLPTEQWEQLNLGEQIFVKEIPDVLKEYVEIVEETKKEKKKDGD